MDGEKSDQKSNECLAQCLAMLEQAVRLVRDVRTPFRTSVRVGERSWSENLTLVRC